MKFMMARLRKVALGAFLVTGVYGMVQSDPAFAVPIAYDDFAYGAGSLVGQAGGTGDWKDIWQGDSGVVVATGGYTYVDSLGNTLDVLGNRIESSFDSGSPNKVTRPLNNKLGLVDETIWLSAILDGTSTTSILNLSLGDGLFFGQGGKDFGGTTWQLSDQDGLVSDTGISSDSRVFIVVRIDFTASGDEFAWLWVDPVLDTTPTTASADASGTIKSFEADFIQMQLQVPALAGIDGFRTGTSFADIAPFTAAVPEPGTAAILGAGLIWLSMRTRRLAGVCAAARATGSSEGSTAGPRQTHRRLEG